MRGICLSGLSYTLNWNFRGFLLPISCWWPLKTWMISPLGCIELSGRNRRLSPRKSQWKWQLPKPTRCSGLRVWGLLEWSLFCLQDIWERNGRRSDPGTSKEASVGNFLADRAALGLHWVHLSLHLPSCYTDHSGAVIATQTIRHHLCQRIFFLSLWKRS